AFPEEFDAGAARAAERQLDHLCPGHDRQVLAAHHRPQVGARRTGAHAAPDVDVHGANALGLGDVQVVQVRHPEGPTCLDERGSHRVETLRPIDVDRPPGPPELARPVLPVLRLLEQGQHGAEVPAGVAGRRPVVVVGSVTAGPDHAVDAPRAAEHLAEPQLDGAAEDVRARLVTISPVVARAEVFHPLRRVPEAGVPSPPTPSPHPKDTGPALPPKARAPATRRRGARTDKDVVVTSGEQADVANAPALGRFLLGHGFSLSPGESSGAIYATRLRGDPRTNASMF